MTVKELCRKYGLKYQTVYKKIAHYKPNELAGHITKEKGESLDLDDFAVNFLLPTNVQILQTVKECERIALENDDLKGKLRRSKSEKELTEKKMSVVYNELATVKEQAEQLEAQCEAYRQKISELESNAGKLEIRLAELTEANSSLNAQLEAIPKIFRKNT